MGVFGHMGNSFDTGHFDPHQCQTHHTHRLKLNMAAAIEFSSMSTQGMGTRRECRKNTTETRWGEGTQGDGRWKWWGWSPALMNSEEVHQVHVAHWNAGTAGKLFSFDLVLVYTNKNLGLRLTFVLFGHYGMVCSPGVKVTKGLCMFTMLKDRYSCFHSFLLPL